MSNLELPPQLQAEVISDGFSLGAPLPLEQQAPSEWSVPAATILRIINCMPGDLADKNLRLRIPTEETETSSFFFANDRICLDDAQKVIKVDERNREFTPNQFHLLSKLVKNVDTVVTSRALEEAVWEDKVLINNDLHVLITNTRRKLGPDLRRAIRTVRGFGYQALSQFE